ncbi:RHS repeat-associated core domain-containing protein [Streptomonospora algeriensis]|uniref:RHS repeat-associated core domain-containing protein n=1 Tax=Streptomonospora algeriensis TaxID=995084 RepID=A0ABW3B9U9_9ACTN
MSDSPASTEPSNSRSFRIITRITAGIVAASLLNAMPASALLVNDRPQIQDAASVEGEAFGTPAAEKSDAVDKAAVKRLGKAAWPEPATVALDKGESGQAQARSFTAPGKKQDHAVSLGPVTEKVRTGWESPLELGDAGGAGEEPADERPAPTQPENTGSPAPPPSPEPGPDEGASPTPSETTPSVPPSSAPQPEPDPTPTPTPAPSPDAQDAETADPDAETADPDVEAAELEVLDRKQARRLGIDGLLLRLTRTDGAEGAAPVQVGVNYADFASAFGGDYGSRLDLVALDDCPGTGEDCVRSVDLDAVNDTDAQTLTATAPATGGEGTLLAVAADTESEGGTGDYSATKLQPSAEWNVGTQTGGFSWSYPMAAPPVAGDLTPDIALGYSSQSVDGRTAGSNNQTSWIGEGFSFEPGYVERRYELCTDAGRDVGDQCWARQNATLSLGGTSTELIVDDDGDWHLKDDDGSDIERLTGATNGDDNGEYWKLTTPEGTQYFFGRNRLPGWSEGDPTTNSALTVPVYGDDSGDPCNESSFADSWCQQAYKWNLDYVVDAHGNAMAFHYDQETNHYGRNLESEATPYDRGGYLKRIDYGLREDAPFATAPAQVKFEVSERCLPTDSFDCAPGKRTEANAEHWPDVPLDRECGSGEDCSGNHSPAFFSTKKLDQVTTRVHDGDGYQRVDSWELDHQYPDPGDGTDPALWLDAITHTAHTGGGEPQTYPAVTFNGTPLQNRVDARDDGLAPMYKWRITAVYTETGGQIDVSYSDAQCQPDDTPEPHTNSKRCYPVIWTPEGEQELTDWFHKYVVTQTAEIDLVADQPDVITAYDYQGGAGWAYDKPDGITPEDRKTWSVFRGYEKVTVRTGHPDATRTETEHLFYRGMDGDHQPDGEERSVTLTDSRGDTVTDHEAFNGTTREVITRNGEAGDTVDTTVTTPWKKQTAERDYDWGTRRAHLSGTKKTETHTALQEGWRTTRTVNHFDEYGYIVRTDDQGDVDDAGDDRCTRTTYARNTDTWLLDAVARKETVDVGCSAEADRPADVISDNRTLYDGQDFGEAPTKGMPTATQRLADYTEGQAQYQTTKETTYDDYGRAVSETDALGNTTTTEHTQAIEGGAATETTTTNPAGHTTTEAFDLRHKPVTETDANGNTTSLAYDPFGRLQKVWLADRPKDTFTANPSMEFTYDVSKDAPAVVTTTALNPNGGYTTAYEIYDGLLRPRQTQKPSTGAGRRVTDTFHDSRGNAVVERDPYYNDDDPVGELFVVNNDDEIPRQTETIYDGAGRVTDELHVSRGEEQWRTTTAHLGDRTEVTKPEGGTGTTTVTDARGRTVEQRKHHGNTPEGDYDATTYTYAKNDEIATLTDPSGATWDYTYDLRGRKTRMDDPDTGVSTYSYDAADQQITTTDARGQTLHTTYDKLGRKTELRDDSADGTLRAEWVYDTVEKGQITSSTRYVDGEAYTTRVLGYDEVYRERAKQITIPQSEEGLAGTYRYRTTYNPDGSVQASGFPAAGGLNSETVSHTYDDLGQPTAITGWETIVNETLYSQTGDLVQREFSRGTFGAEKTWQTRDYDEATDRLDMTSLVHQSGDGSLTSRHYSYDDVGNVLSIRDKPTDADRDSDVQCFDYDHQRRLTDAWTPNATGEGACAAEPASGELGGPAPYWNSYTYDAVGNRLTKTSHGTTGNTLSTYTPPAEGEGPAHGVAEVSETSEGAAASGNGEATTSTYGYDAGGNMVSRSTDDQDQELTWNAEGNLASVQSTTGSAGFVYGPDGDRLIRRQGAEWTLYLPGQEVTWTAGEGTEVTRYYEHAGETVAVRENDGTLHWLFSDHNGTAQIAVDAEWGTVQQRRFTAFGQARSGTESWPGEKGFVGGTVDEDIGLTQLGARSYDAELGRFISVDPLIDPADQQMMHGYAYANNSPVSMTDPSGMRAMCGVQPCDTRESYSGGNGSSGSYGYHPSIMGLAYAPVYGYSRTEILSGYYGIQPSGYHPAMGGPMAGDMGYYSGSSSGGGGGGGGRPAVDPYANNSHEYSDAEQAQQQAEEGGNWFTDRYTGDSGGFAWGQALDDAGLVLGAVGLVGAFAACSVVCLVAAGVSAAIGLGRGFYKVSNGNNSGWLDMAGGVTFGVGKAGGAAYKLTKGLADKRILNRAPKGVPNMGRKYKRMRKRMSRQHEVLSGQVAVATGRLDTGYTMFNTMRGGANEIGLTA